MGLPLGSTVEGQDAAGLCSNAIQEAGEYENLKEAILKRYNFSEESYRMKFRAVSRRAEESYSEMATRTMDLLHK